nr:uncharacterized protein LOC117278635 [Nicotiana tomentosiformis]
MPFNGRKPILPVTMRSYRFLDALGLDNSRRSLRSIKEGWRRAQININLLPVVLATFHGNLQATLVPMVLAEMLRALSASCPKDGTGRNDLKNESLEQQLKNIQGLAGQKSIAFNDLCMFPDVRLPLGFKTPKFEKYDGHGDPIAHLKSLEQQLKNIQGLAGQKSIAFNDLCMFPDVRLPLGFKTPKFEKYDGHGDPIAHLKRYCNQLRSAGGQEELLMAYFGESLTGLASEWFKDQDTSRWYVWDDMAHAFVKQFQYNINIAPDRNSFSNLKKKPTESFGEYAIK